MEEENDFGGITEIHIEAFTENLRSRNKSASTLHNYTANVKGLAKKLKKPILREDLEEILATSKSVHMLNMRKIAWNAFADFMNETYDARLPDVRKQRGSSENPIQEMTPELKEAIRELRSRGFNARMVACLQWRDVDLTAFAGQHETISVRHPHERSTEISVPRWVIATLLDHTTSNAGVNTPLLPRHPDSDEPYPVNLIRKATQKGLNEFLDLAEEKRQGQVIEDKATLAEVLHEATPVNPPPSPVETLLPPVEDEILSEGSLLYGPGSPLDRLRALPPPPPGTYITEMHEPVVGAPGISPRVSSTPPPPVDPKAEALQALAKLSKEELAKLVALTKLMG